LGKGGGLIRQRVDILRPARGAAAADNRVADELLAAQDIQVVSHRHGIQAHLARQLVHGGAAMVFEVFQDGLARLLLFEAGIHRRQL
jgi:hypothetical protein